MSVIDNIVIGAGPAAAAVVSALVEDRRQSVTVLDVGTRLERWRQELLDEARIQPVALWPTSTRRALSEQPKSVGAVLPEKRVYGSDFPFRDEGQLAGVEAEGGANPNLVSSAFGGFSNVWGAQVMPFTRPTIDRWPVSYADMTAAYRDILRLIPFAGVDDDLAELFPLLVAPAPLPRLAPRTETILRRYERSRHRIRPLGITVGAARLAFDASRCTRCGLCMTGCPDGLIFSASHLLDSLIAHRSVRYQSRSLVLEVTEDATGASVRWKDPATGRLHERSADRVFVAAGGIGSTRLLATLKSLEGKSLKLQEALQFVLPALSIRSAGDPRQQAAFTLNQFNVALQLDEDGRDLPFIHFYPYNAAMLEAVPRVLRVRSLDPALASLMARLTVGLGYLPSWASPTVQLRIGARRHDGELPEVTVRRDDFGDLPMLKATVSALRRVAPWLDLWPMPGVRLGAAGKSYHFGGTLPMAEASDPRELVADRLGRPRGIRRVHFVDGAVLPDIPATTFTLTVMANARRIAVEAMKREIEAAA